MALRRLSVSLKRGYAMRVEKISVGKDKLCYVLVVDRKIQYSTGRSSIVYVGTTEKGVQRISQSISAKAHEVLAMHGVQSFEARIVTCRPRQNVKSWRKLERVLLLGFKELYGEIPRLNSHGVRYKETDEFQLFKRSRIRTILEDIG